MADMQVYREPLLLIREGETYIYTADYPPGCKGHRYRVLRLVKYEPHKVKLVCVEPLSGPDKGDWFVCSEANFARRYMPVPPDPAPEEKAAGATHTGTGV